MKPRQFPPLALCVLLLAGCTVARQSRLERALADDRSSATRTRDLPGEYAVRCPDVLTLTTEGRPGACGKRVVDPSGCIRIEGEEIIRVEGQTPPAIARAVARHLDLPPQAVQVRMEEYQSQKLYIFGDAGELQTVVAYRGPETVLELLRRTIGIQEGRALADVHVVRSHVADGRPPEVFTVDVEAILLHNDPQTNIRLEPFDRIHVGQSRPSRVAGRVPKWFKPFISRICGLKTAAPAPPLQTVESPRRGQTAGLTPGLPAN